MTTTRRLFIHGRVQGIGFRWALMNEAKRLGLGGWVRNCSDGSVEALLIGPLEAVDDLTLWAHHGPPQARVDHVISRDEPEDRPADGTMTFSLRSTR